MVETTKRFASRRKIEFERDRNVRKEMVLLWSFVKSWPYRLYRRKLGIIERNLVTDVLSYYVYIEILRP
jgi:hypothetical protein